MATADDAGTTAIKSHGFGALVRRHRLAASLSQELLAERARLSAATIAAVERGRSTTPRPATVLLLADALGLTPQERAALIDAATRTSKAEAVETSSVARAMRHNLPQPLTNFVGRQRDLADVQRSLSEARLVTLTGPGGVGKTRLALEVALQLARSGPAPFADGIWRVELAPLADGALVPRAMASVLGVQEVPEQPVLEPVVGATSCSCRTRHLAQRSGRARGWAARAE